MEKFNSSYYRDWEKESEYEYLLKKNWSYFAWEFLRRNNKYQQLQKQWWEDVRKHMQSLKDEEFQHWTAGISREILRQQAIPYEGKHADVAVSINEAFGIDVYVESDDKFCVNSPNRKHPPQFISMKVYLPEREEPIVSKKNKLLFEVDLDLPIDFTVGKIHRFLNNYNKYLSVQLAGKCHEIKKKSKVRKRDRARLILYIRILDAKAVCASNDKIKNMLFKGISNEYPERKQDKRLQDCTKESIKFVDGGYKKLCFML